MARIFLVWIVFGILVHGAARLQVGRTPSEFLEARIEAKLEGRFLTRSYKLVFGNDGERQVEGEFFLSLAEGEQVSAYAMDVNGVRREGIVAPAGEARRAYEEIVRQKVDPGLVEIDEKRCEFRARVFPIPAKGTKTIWLTTFQVIKNGMVQMLPDGLGKPRKWTVTVTGRGGQEDFRQVRHGANSPVSTIARPWRPLPHLRYQAEEETIRFLSPSPWQKQVTKEVRIWMDVSAKYDDSAISLLSQLLRDWQVERVELRRFGFELSDPVLVKVGGFETLLRQIGGHQARGMARPSLLPVPLNDSVPVILLTDGVFPEGKGDWSGFTGGLHVIDAGKGMSKWLRVAALSSGGGWHGKRLDPYAGGVASAGASIIGEWEGELVMLTQEEAQISSQAAAWFRRTLELQKMRKDGAPQSVCDAFQIKYKVADESASWLVLETGEQYARYGMEPPSGDELLFRDWKKALAAKKEETNNVTKDLLAEWEGRAAVFRSTPPSSSLILKQYVIRSLFRWSGYLQRGLVVEEKVQPLFSAFGKLLASSGNAVEFEDLKKIREFQTELGEELGFIQVTMGGQVRGVGSFNIPAPAMLSQVLEIAGGATPFGATNRIKIFRKGRIYVVNVKKRDFELHDGDTIEVPEKNIWGNGGTPHREPKMIPKPQQLVVEAATWEPERPYVKVLERFLKKNWEAVYLAQRSAYGWRADFYLDVIELLERSGMIREAVRVTGELARLMPENPEILRRAGRSFRRLGEMKLADALFKKVLSLTPGSSVSLADVAWMERHEGNLKSAARTYWQAALAAQQEHSPAAMVYLEEVAGLLTRGKLSAVELDLPVELDVKMNAPLRVVLRWDSKMANLDLVHRDSLGQLVRSCHDIDQAWLASGNVARAFGPESRIYRTLLPGKWEFLAFFYGDWAKGQSSFTTAEMEVIRDFGSSSESRQIHARRLDEKEIKTLVSVVVKD